VVYIRLSLVSIWMCWFIFKKKLLTQK